MNAFTGHRCPLSGHKLKTAYAKLIKYELDHCLVTITFPNFK